MTHEQIRAAMSAPTPPTLRELTAMLRETQEAFSHPIAGPCEVGLSYDADDGWQVRPTWQKEFDYQIVGCELVPGDAKLPFDAVACARRLLAAWRDAQ